MKWFARQKMRLELGQSFLALINLAFLILASSDKISTLVHVPAKILVPVLVPASFIVIWVIGFVLDRFRFLESYQEEMNQRNALLKSVHESVKSRDQEGGSIDPAPQFQARKHWAKSGGVLESAGKLLTGLIPSNRP